MHTPATISDATALDKELRSITKQGWAVAPNEAVTGLNALATPIFDASGKLVASIAIVDSLQFIPEKPTDLQIATMTNAGKAISESIGFRPGRSMNVA